jgi:alpha-L-fucosidase
LGLSVPGLILARQAAAAGFLSGISEMKYQEGGFAPTRDSLQKYRVPEWFRDAKFGLWAHWGPQCQPEAGDWYARGMYQEGSHQYKFHLEKYGHPSIFGFKDVINEWKTEKWNPEELVAFYKRAGAKYFFAMANHHDNLDLYDSKYQKDWNSTKVGPKRDIIGGWAKAAKNQSLPLGVSVHAVHAWSWYETAQRADKTGKYADVPYDGTLTKADGKGKWWKGLDPQDLYAQNHPLSENSQDDNMIHKQWHWGNGVAKPTDAYIEKFYNRTIDLIDKYQPDVIYFDDSQLPFWPISDAGLRIAAHMYNKSIKDCGELRSVICGKILDENQRKAMVWDIERGQSNTIEPLPWQTDTCIGGWHYDLGLYEQKRYKSAKIVIHTLIDVVSKNGNLLLNVPVRGDGSIDELDRQVVEEIGRWMNANGESIYGTRPWKVFGEGPAQENAATLSAQGFNERKGKPFTSEDIRFVSKGNVLFATALGWSESSTVTIKSLADGNVNYPEKINRVELGSNKQSLRFERTSQGLVVYFPEIKPVDSYAVAMKIY